MSNVTSVTFQKMTKKNVCTLTSHKTKSMTLDLKLFLFHILYTCDNKIAPFSSVCVKSHNVTFLQPQLHGSIDFG